MHRGVEVDVGDGDGRAFDLDALVLLELDLGPNRDRGLEAQRFARLAGQQLDVGLLDGHEVVVADHLGVGAGQDVADGALLDLV